FTCQLTMNEKDPNNAVVRHSSSTSSSIVRSSASSRVQCSLRILTARSLGAQNLRRSRYDESPSLVYTMYKYMYIRDSCCATGASRMNLSRRLAMLLLTLCFVQFRQRVITVGALRLLEINVPSYLKKGESTRLECSACNEFHSYRLCGVTRGCSTFFKVAEDEYHCENGFKSIWCHISLTYVNFTKTKKPIYDLDSDKFYSVTWYKDNEHIFSISRKTNKKQVFLTDGVRIDQREENKTREKHSIVPLAREIANYLGADKLTRVMIVVNRSTGTRSPIRRMPIERQLVHHPVPTARRSEDYRCQSTVRSSLLVKKKPYYDVRSTVIYALVQSNLRGKIGICKATRRLTPKDLGSHGAPASVPTEVSCNAENGVIGSWLHETRLASRRTRATGDDDCKLRCHRYTERVYATAAVAHVELLCVCIMQERRAGNTFACLGAANVCILRDDAHTTIRTRYDDDDDDYNDDCEQQQQQQQQQQRNNRCQQS
ncbi:unnamed protein product, partial [Trichogramma brassicae]